MTASLSNPLQPAGRSPSKITSRENVLQSGIFWEDTEPKSSDWWLAEVIPSPISPYKTVMTGAELWVGLRIERPFSRLLALIAVFPFYGHLPSLIHWAYEQEQLNLGLLALWNRMKLIRKMTTPEAWWPTD